MRPARARRRGPTGDARGRRGRRGRRGVPGRRRPGDRRAGVRHRVDSRGRRDRRPRQRLRGAGQAGARRRGRGHRRLRGSLRGRDRRRRPAPTRAGSRPTSSPRPNTVPAVPRCWSPGTAALADAVDAAIADLARRRTPPRRHRGHPRVGWAHAARRRRRAPHSGRSTSSPPSTSSSSAPMPRPWPTGSATRARSSSVRTPPRPLGDYIAGVNHVLPTARTARFAERAAGRHVLQAHPRRHGQRRGLRRGRAVGGGARQRGGPRRARPLGDHPARCPATAEAQEQTS